MEQTKYVKTEILKAERKSYGYTYKDMAKKIGYNSPTTYMYIEKGQTIPNLLTMLKIAKVFGKPVSYFFKLDIQE